MIGLIAKEVEGRGYRGYNIPKLQKSLKGGRKS